MGVKFLLELLENRTIPNAVVEVDLLQVAREFVKSNKASSQKKSDTAAVAGSPKFCLVLDGECCLNRLYGGFFSDWICGGQWNRMAEFLDKLITLAESADIELTVFFNGAIESQRMKEWIAQQKREYEKMNRVLSHVAKFGYPPSNKLWIPPVGLRMALRMMLRHKNVNVVSTIDDYRQEVIAYCRENNFHGIITDDAEYIAFDPPRLFSANKFKLKFKGTLESREFVVSELMKELQLTNEKLCVLVALLGNYLLTEYDLRDVYKKANIDLPNESTAAECVVKKLAKYLNDINTTNDLDEIVTQIFGDENDARGPTLKQSIQYYMDGTKDGFLKYRSVSSGKCGNVSGGDTCDDEAKNNLQNSDIYLEPDLDTTKLASENATGEKNLLNSFKEAQSCFNSSSIGRENSAASSTTSTASSTTIEGCSDDVCNRDANISGNYDSSVTSTSSETSISSPPPATLDESSKTTSAAKTKNGLLDPPVLPPVPHEVMRTVSERHSKGLMSPYIYQILSQGEIKLPVIMEDGKQVPNIYLFYKPIRQMVYAIVFNLHHHTYMASKNNTAVELDIRIKEWIFNATAQTYEAEYVKAERVGWRVPTIERLWFGTTQDDKRRRLRAFLTCMRSDVQLLLNPEFVPQQLLVAAVVLRYIMSFPEKKILRKPELDAFIVAALSPEFSLAEFIQDVKIPQLSCRGIQLAALFMKGVEMAMLVNDACGAPIPWLMCCPWLFFDGKLFHYMFVKATGVKNLHELCDNRVGLVMRAERMRQAILEGLNVQFARPPLPPTMLPSPAAEEFKSVAPYSHPHHYQQQYHHHHHHHQQQPQQQHHHHQHHHSQTHSRPSYMSQHRLRMTATTTHSSSSAAPSMGLSSGMGCGGRPMSSLAGGGAGRGNGGRRSLGGRLEIAGVVVGSWGANYNLSQPPYESAAAASATAAYILPAGAQQLPLQHRSHHQFTKKKPAKKEKPKLGKGRGLGIVSSGSCGGVSSSSHSTNNADSTVSRVSTNAESELPNGEVSTTSTARIDSNEADDRSGRGDGDGHGTDIDDRFQDVILNGAVGTGGGDGDGGIVKGMEDDTTVKSSVEAISK